MLVRVSKYTIGVILAVTVGLGILVTMTLLAIYLVAMIATIK